jgi:hypothetical protein
LTPEIPPALRWINPTKNKATANLVGATQYRNIYEQLTLGVRMVDLRFCYYGPSSSFRICHGSFGPDSVDILNQVKRFIEEPTNSHEVVFVKIRNFDSKEVRTKWNTDADQGSKFIGILESALGKHINHGWTIHSSIQEIIATGKRILILGDHLPPRNYIKSENGLLRNTWANKDNLDELQSQLTTYNNDRMKVHFGKGMLTMLEYQLTMGKGAATIKHFAQLNSLRDFSRKVRGHLENFVRNNLKSCEYCNFIMTDVVEENPSILLAIDISLERARKLYQTDNLYSTGTYQLSTGESITSANGQFVFFQQHDGNLVLYKHGHGAKWASHTRGTNCRLLMQNDGNLVEYCNEGVRWASHTSRFNGQGPFRFLVQNDGNLVIYANNGHAIWASNTAGAVTLSESINDIEGLEEDTPQEDFNGNTLDDEEF